MAILEELDQSGRCGPATGEMMSTASEEPTKVCRLCGEEKPLSAFRRNRAAKDGRSPRCRVCLRAADRAYVELRRDELNQKARETRKQEPERFAQYEQKRRAQHLEEIRRYDRERKRKEREERRAERAQRLGKSPWLPREDNES